MAEKRIVKEPLFYVSKRTDVSLKRQILSRVIAILIGLLLGGIVCLIVYGESPLDFIKYIFEGNFKPSTRIWELLKGTALLLGVSLALIPAFKMKFWNLGGNGQILIGALITTLCMYYWGGKIDDGLLWVIMLIVAILAGAIWAIIPAIFKAFFNTNESLFTLMMNYIAVGLVEATCKELGGPSAKIDPIYEGALPTISNDAILVALVVTVLTIFLCFYIKKSKHGFEISVVGDSENTAKYAGINVKKVIIRTMAVSGAICGIVGFLIAGAIDHTVSKSSANNMGFTAIIAVWVANMSPIYTIATSFGIMFLTYGVERAKNMFVGGNKSVTDMIVGLMYLVIIACVFFISYKVTINKNRKKKMSVVTNTTSSNADNSTETEKE